MAIISTLGDYYCYSSVTKACSTLCNAMDGSKPGFPALHYHKLTSVELMMPSNHLVLCLPLLLLPSISPSTRVFSSESALHIRWPKYWNFFSIHPSDGYSGLISFRMDWFDLPAVQGPLMSLLQHHSSKESILWCSAFFMGLLWRWNCINAQ